MVRCVSSEPAADFALMARAFRCSSASSGSACIALPDRMFQTRGQIQSYQWSVSAPLQKCHWSKLRLGKQLMRAMQQSSRRSVFSTCCSNSPKNTSIMKQVSCKIERRLCVSWGHPGAGRGFHTEESTLLISQALPTQLPPPNNMLLRGPAMRVMRAAPIARRLAGSPGGLPTAMGSGMVRKLGSMQKPNHG